jgi:hypothetical protein
MEEILGEFNFQYVDGCRYLGGFIGSASAEGEGEWVREKVDGWANGVKALAKVARRYPQTAYTGFTRRSLQMEWTYL